MNLSFITCVVTFGFNAVTINLFCVFVCFKFKCSEGTEVLHLCLALVVVIRGSGHIPSGGVVVHPHAVPLVELYPTNISGLHSGPHTSQTSQPCSEFFGRVPRVLQEPHCQGVPSVHREPYCQRIPRVRRVSVFQHHRVCAPQNHGVPNPLSHRIPEGPGSCCYSS